MGSCAGIGAATPGSVADYLIAATAQHRGAALATLNVRQFPKFPELEPPWN